MTDSYDADGLNDLTPPLDLALHATLTADIPQDAVERVKLRAKQLAKSTPVVTPLPRPRAFREGSPIPVLSWTMAVAVAGIAVMLVLGILPNPPRSAFADVVQNVHSATAVKFNVVIDYPFRGFQPGTISIAGNRMRCEFFDGKLVQIADFDRRQALFLNQPGKIAQTHAINPDIAKGFNNPITELRNLQLQDARRIGEEDFRGQRLHLYRIDKINFMGFDSWIDTTVYVDAQTNLPVRIVCEDKDPKASFKVQFEAFVWNPKLEEKLFSLELPEGYKPGEVFLNPEKPKPLPKPSLSEVNPQFANGILSSDRPAAQIVVSPDGKQVTALLRNPEADNKPGAYQPNELRQWDLATGKLLWSETIAGANWVAGTPDGKQLATVIGREIQLRDATTGKITRTWETHRQVSPLAFSPDGKFLAAGIAEWINGQEQPGGIEIWNVEQGSLARLITDDQPIAWVKYSPDGSRIVTTTNMGPVKVWDATNAQLVRIFPGYLRADFSPDGQELACPSSERGDVQSVTRINVFKVTSGELVRSLTSDPGRSMSTPLWVEYSADGSKLVASDWNQTVVMWNTKSGDRIPTTTTHTGGVHVARFTPDGEFLVTGSEDKTLHVWKLPADSK